MISTWGEALDYTFKTRPSWRNGSGRKTAAINSNHFTEAVGRSFPIEKINQALISTISLTFEDAGKSDATINRIVSAVSTVLNHCCFDGLIDSAPKFRRRKESEGRVLYYTRPEVDQLIDISHTLFMRDDLADVIMFAAYTGMRQGEILKLRPNDIDWNSDRIIVGGEDAVKTKAANVRHIPIHERIKDMLLRRSQASRTHLVFGEDWVDHDQLLRNFKKVNRMIRKPDEYVFHTLRHSFATWHAEAGTPLRTLMALMGHKRIETTLRYAKATDKALSEAMLAI